MNSITPKGALAFTFRADVTLTVVPILLRGEPTGRYELWDGTYQIAVLSPASVAEFIPLPTDRFVGDWVEASEPDNFMDTIFPILPDEGDLDIGQEVTHVQR